MATSSTIGLSHHPTPIKPIHSPKSFEDLSEPSSPLQSKKSTYKSRSLDSKDFNVIYTDFIGERTGSIRDYYSLLSPPIGTGAFGEVRRAIHLQTNVTRAVKIIKKSLTCKEQQESLINEVNILKMIDHPNIMKVFEFFQDEECFYIVSEYCNGGELFDKISSMTDFSEKFAAETMKQILSAIIYCHHNNIVHRDLKPEDILYDSKRPGACIKVADFGTSTLFTSEGFLQERIGTIYYVAPEVLRKNYTEKCDLWSCGVILYILLCGQPPFSDDDENITLSRILKAQYNFDGADWKNISPQAKSLVRKLLNPDMNKRYSALEALNDPWFKLVLGEPTLDEPLAISTLNNLKQFRANRKLQHAIWMFLVSYFVTSEERKHLLRRFKALDTLGDGQISKNELIKWCQTLMKSSDPETEAEEILKDVDNSGSGTINYTEFIIATINRENLLKRDRLESTFKLLDKNGEGFLTADKLEEMFNPGKQRDIDSEFWNEIISEFDQSGDGKLTFQEFKDMMKKII